MKSSRTSTIQVFATAALSLLLTAPALAVQTYFVQSLGALSPRAINDLGVVTGPIYANNQAPDAWPTGINNTGLVVGSYREHAAQWQGDQLTLLSELPGSTSSYANAVNDQGDIVGESGGIAVRWHNGEVSALPSPQGSTGFEASAINQSGTIAGAIAKSDEHRQAVTWKDGLVQVLPFPTGFNEADPESATNSRAFGINGHDTVVGYVSQHWTDSAAVWQNGQVQVLSPLLGSGQSLAYGINDVDEIVGYSFGGNGGDLRATLWDQGQAYDLTDLTINAQGWDFSMAFGINQIGQIIGLGSLNGQGHGFLLTPTTVPEADASVLALIGLGAVMWPIKRRKALADQA